MTARAKHQRSTPYPHPNADGFHKSWISNVIPWIDTARRLLRSEHLADIELGFVAAYVAINYTQHLVKGWSTVPPERTARDDCPVDRRRLIEIRERLRWHRNLILHLADELEEGGGLSLDFSATAPHLTVASMSPDADSQVTRDELEPMLEVLRPWAAGHWRRLVG